MLTGTYHTSKVIHYARLSKTVPHGDGEIKLYVSGCANIRRGMISYLNETDAPQQVTCKRCLAWAAKLAESKARAAARKSS